MGEETAVHAPKPFRSIPFINTPPEDMNLLSPRGGGYVSATSHLHGTRRHCVRHGRSDHIRQTARGNRKAFAGTRDLVAKSRSGAYIPTGQIERRQMEATSPWLFSSRDSDEGLMEGLDACPDCVQETTIKRREMYDGLAQGRVVHGNGGSAATVKRPLHEHLHHHLYAPASHSYSAEPSAVTDSDPLATPLARFNNRAKPIHYEIGTHVESGPSYDSAWHATPYQPSRPAPKPATYESQMPNAATDQHPFDPAWHASPHHPARPPIRLQVSQHAAGMTSTTDEPEDLVITKQLGDGLNAVIVEHQGHLRRIIFNRRTDEAEIERLRRLSRELASVSTAIAFASASKNQRVSETRPQYTVVLDKAPGRDSAQRDDHSKSSIPELLSMIDQAAGEIDPSSETFSNGGAHDRLRSVNRGQSLMHSDEANNTLFDLPSPGQQIAHRQGMDEVMGAAREKLEGAGAPLLASVEAENGANPSAEARKLSMVGKRDQFEDVFARSTPSRPAPVIRLARETPRAETSKIQTPSTSKFTLSAKPEQSLHATATSQTAKPNATTQPAEPSFIETPQTATPALPVEPALRTDKPPTPADPQPVDDPPIASVPDPPIVAPLAPTTLQQHSYLPNFLAFNPCSPHRTSHPPSNPEPETETEYPPHLSPTPSPSAAPPVTAQPAPYHHAPSAPLDLYSAVHSDPGVRERGQVIRAAIRMDRTKTREAVREAAAAREREGRREGLLRRRESGAGFAVRRGWFG